jgi:hypothetical protein
MGRLAFLKQTTPLALADARTRYCLVDYSCPDRCGDWLIETFPTDAASGRTVVERVTGRSLFNKSAAHNRGARRAIREGADYLCLLDADTRVTSGFFPWVAEHARPGRFLIASRLPDGTDPPSLTGLLVLHVDAFLESGGLDEGFRGWGFEDIEFRIRLRLLHGLEHADIPLGLVQAIPHGDDLRTQFYRQKSCAVSNRTNLRRLKHRIWHAWRDRWKVDPETLERLWYRGFPLP